MDGQVFQSVIWGLVIPCTTVSYLSDHGVSLSSTVTLYDEGLSMLAEGISMSSHRLISDGWCLVFLLTAT